MKVKRIIAALLAALMLFSLAACTDSYERTARSAYDKFSRGDFDSMTAQEKAHIDGFLKSLG